MDATCTIQDSIHVFSLVHKYVSRILGTYQMLALFISVIYIFAAVSQYHKNNPDDDPQEDPAQVEQNDLAQEFSQYEQR